MVLYFADIFILLGCDNSLGLDLFTTL